jgi:hypothetical protein
MFYIQWFARYHSIFRVFETSHQPKNFIAITTFLYMFIKYHDLKYFISKYVMVDWCKKYRDIPWLCAAGKVKKKGRDWAELVDGSRCSIGFRGPGNVSLWPPSFCPVANRLCNANSSSHAQAAHHTYTYIQQESWYFSVKLF